MNTQLNLDKYLNNETVKSFSELTEVVEHRREKKALKRELKRNKKNNDKFQTQLI